MRTYIRKYVPREGIEPSRTQGPRDFKSLVSTNSTTWAKKNEAPSGFEPLHEGFAGLSLTAWVRRR